jgi:hypothetical protein
MFIVFFALDIRNPAMAWIDNRITKTMLIIYAASVMTLAIGTLKGIRRAERRQAERQTVRRADHTGMTHAGQQSDDMLKR